MSYLIRRYQEADKAQVFGLIEDCLGRPAAEKTRKRWNWEFSDNPNKNAQVPLIFVLEKDKRIAGLISSFPVSLKVRDSVLPALWVGDFMSHAQDRGRGAFLLRKILREPYLMLGTPNKNSDRIAEKLGSIYVGRLAEHMNFLNPGRILKAQGKNSLLALAGGIFLSVAAAFLRVVNRPMRVGGVSVERIDAFDEKIDDFWREVSLDYGIIVVRDRKYLNWRFFAYPDGRLNYSVYIAKRNAGISGYIVFRSFEEKGLRKGCIVDILAKREDRETLSVLIKTAVESLKTGGVDWISCLIPPQHKGLNDILKKNGFIFKRYNYNLFFYNKHFPSSNSDLRDQGNWFITKSDSDIDMF